MIDILYSLRSQESTKEHPGRGGLGQLDSQGFCRSDSSQLGAGFEDVVVNDLSFHKGSESEVTFEASEGSSSGFEVGPFSLQGIVVGALEKRFVDQVLFGVDTEVLEGADVTPETVGEDFGFSHLWGGVVGHGEGVAGGLGVTSSGEVVTQVGVVARDVDEPEPSLPPHALELGFIGEESGFSPPFFGDDGQLPALVGQQESGFVTPAGDGVVGHLDLVQVAEGVHDRWGGHGAEEGEVEGQCYCRRREFHPIPVEDPLYLSADEADVFGVHHQVEGFIPGQGNVDLVSAAAVPLCVMPVAAESQGVTEVLEDTHPRAAFGANHLGVLADSGWAVRDELSPTVGVFTAITLQTPMGVSPEAVDTASAPGTPNIMTRVGHINLLSSRGVRF